MGEQTRGRFAWIGVGLGAWRREVSEEAEWIRDGCQCCGLACGFFLRRGQKGRGLRRGEGSANREGGEEGRNCWWAWLYLLGGLVGGNGLDTWVANGPSPRPVTVRRPSFGAVLEQSTRSCTNWQNDGELENLPNQTVHVRISEDFDSKCFTDTCNSTAPFCKYSISKLAMRFPAKISSLKPEWPEQHCSTPACQ